ncbi:MAG: tetratricopeptide repeat protein [Hyphomonadaceae bacterium]
MSVRRFFLTAAIVGGALILPGAAWASCESAAGAPAPSRARANDAAIANILNDAAAALARGDFGEACVKYRLVLSVDRDNGAALIGLGEGALGEGNAEAARAHFEAVARAMPGSALAYQGIGLSYLIAGDFNAAEAPLRRSTGMDHSLWRSWNGLGIIADAKGDWTSADAAWSAAIAAAPDRANLHNNKGMSLVQRGQPANAVAAFDAALALDPTLTTASNNRRIALAMIGLYDTALSGVSERDLPAALNNVAVVAARRGDREVADRLLSAAITASPRYYELAVRNLETVGPARR